MKTTQEIAAKAFATRDRQIKKKKQRMRLAALAAVLLLSGGGLFFGLHGQKAFEKDSSGFGTDKQTVWSRVVKKGIRLEGEALSEEEGDAFLREHREALIGQLGAMGVSFKAPRFSENGYGHLSLSESGAVLKQNWRDYLLYDGEQLKAVYTLMKENGILRALPTWGGDWLPDYAAFLKTHSGEELVYLYLEGGKELILLPDGRAFTPDGRGAQELLPDRDFDYYAACRTALNTYVP